MEAVAIHAICGRDKSRTRQGKGSKKKLWQWMVTTWLLAWRPSPRGFDCGVEIRGTQQRGGGQYWSALVAVAEEHDALPTRLSKPC